MGKRGDFLRSFLKKDVPQKKEEKIIKEGIVTEALPSLSFRVKTDEGKEILATLAGKMRLNRIRVLVGDRVKIETTPYDEKRGRIVYRSK